MITINRKNFYIFYNTDLLKYLFFLSLLYNFVLWFRYTSAELRYFPVNTVLYGPMRPKEMQKMEESEVSQSESDDSSSSGDSR